MRHYVVFLLNSGVYSAPRRPHPVQPRTTPRTRAWPWPVCQTSRRAGWLWWGGDRVWTAFRGEGLRRGLLPLGQGVGAAQTLLWGRATEDDEALGSCLAWQLWLELELSWSPQLWAHPGGVKVLTRSVRPDPSDRASPGPDPRPRGSAGAAWPGSHCPSPRRSCAKTSCS